MRKNRIPACGALDDMFGARALGTGILSSSGRLGGPRAAAASTLRLELDAERGARHRRQDQLRHEHELCRLLRHVQQWENTLLLWGWQRLNGTAQNCRAQHPGRSSYHGAGNGADAPLSLLGVTLFRGQRSQSWAFGRPDDPAGERVTRCRVRHLLLSRYKNGAVFPRPGLAEVPHVQHMGTMNESWAFTSPPSGVAMVGQPARAEGRLIPLPDPGISRRALSPRRVPSDGFLGNRVVGGGSSLQRMGGWV